MRLHCVLGVKHNARGGGGGNAWVTFVVGTLRRGAAARQGLSVRRYARLVSKPRACVFFSLTPLPYRLMVP